MTITSRTDQAFWSDPDFTESGVRMAHPLPADYEPEPVPYWPLDWVFETVEAMRKRDAIAAEVAEVMVASPLTGGCRE